MSTSGSPRTPAPECPCADARRTMERLLGAATSTAAARRQRHRLPGPDARGNEAEAHWVQSQPGPLWRPRQLRPVLCGSLIPGNAAGAGELRRSTKCRSGATTQHAVNLFDPRGSTFIRGWPVPGNHAGLVSFSAPAGLPSGAVATSQHGQPFDPRGFAFIRGWPVAGNHAGLESCGGPPGFSSVRRSARSTFRSAWFRVHRRMRVAGNHAGLASCGGPPGFSSVRRLSTINLSVRVVPRSSADGLSPGCRGPVRPRQSHWDPPGAPTLQRHSAADPRHSAPMREWVAIPFCGAAGEATDSGTKKPEKPWEWSDLALRLRLARATDSRIMTAPAGSASHDQARRPQIGALL
jgi:hypothetical protein